MSQIDESLVYSYYKQVFCRTHQKAFIDLERGLAATMNLSRFFIAMNCGIYLITNKINGKFYIGSSVDIHKRWISHKCDFNKKRHPNRHLQSANDKYGFSCFEHSILEYCDRSQLKVREQFYLDKMFDKEKCYNIFRESYAVNGVNHPMFGRTHTLEAKIKIKEARSKQTITHSEETRSKISKGNIGKTVSMDHIMKMVKARNGVNWNKGLKLPTAKRHIISNEKLHLILVDYSNEFSINQIKDKYNMCWKRVKSVLQENGIITRTISQEKKLRDERKIKKN